MNCALIANYITFLFPSTDLKKKTFFYSYRKISVHQTAINANGKTLSVLRVNSTEKRDGGIYSCKVIRNLKVTLSMKT